MGAVSVPNTSVQYNNPQQTDQTTLKFPSGAVTAGYPPNVNGSLAGVVWQQNGPTAYPQPGTFMPGSPQISTQPVVNNPGVGVIAPNAGQPMSVTGTGGSTGNPTNDLNRKVAGQVPNGPTFTNPA